MKVSPRLNVFAFDCPPKIHVEPDGAKPGRVRDMNNLCSKAKIDGSRFVKNGAIDLVHTITTVHRRGEKLDYRIEKTWR